MARRTYERDGERLQHADEVQEAVKDKRESWRAKPANARRRQRRYAKRLVASLVPGDSSED